MRESSAVQEHKVDQQAANLKIRSKFDTTMQQLSTRGTGDGLLFQSDNAERNNNPSPVPR